MKGAEEEVQDVNEEDQANVSTADLPPVLTEECTENTAGSLEKSNSSPMLQPLLALPAPPIWKSNNDSSLDVTDENSHKYVGLTNQCQTCYLNSLIQTLFMAPEFRNIIYTIEPKANSKGIHHQLQKLFVQLQTSNKLSLPTVDLTESFGWQNEQLYQHDVQELFRVLIEALEKRWEKTQHKGCIEGLFKGDIIDYVKCLKCGKMKSKPDIYLDLSLAIKADGELRPYKSLEESLTAFTKPEILDGNNKYKCENCDSLEDAEKGLAIKHFPSILAIQLKRYGFDYNTLHRIKLNDRLTFPDFLDLNKYLYNPEPPKPKLSYAQMVSKPSTSKESNNGSHQPSPDENDKEEDDGWINENSDSEKVQKMLENGPHIYELFSVLIHQGSATGGHYYAYIKNLDQQRWFCFNDSTVTNATSDDIKRTFGGNMTLGGFNSSNAYMLMYRRIESKNENFIRTISLPDHMKILLEQIEKDEQESAIQRQLEKERVSIHFICNDRLTISDPSMDLTLHKDIPYLDLRRELCSYYPNINEADCRLVQCNHNWEMNFEFSEDILEPPLNKIHRASYYGKPEGYLMIDTRQGSHFYEIPTIEAGAKTADVFLVNLDDRVVFPVKRVCFDANMTVSDLKGHLCVIPEVRTSDPLRIRIVVDIYQDINHSMTLWDEEQVEIKKMARLIRGENLQLYVDVGSVELLEKDRSIEKYEDTLMYKLLDHKKHSQRLIVWMPSNEDFNNANLLPPNLQTRQPNICPLVEEEGAASKELSVDETDSSSSADVSDDKMNDVFVADPSESSNPPDYVPPDPFCAVSQLNIDPRNKEIDPVNKEIDNSTSLSASSTYSSTNSSAPTKLQQNEPLDPEQMDVLIKTSSSTMPIGDLPPPAYSVLDENKVPFIGSPEAMDSIDAVDLQPMSVQSTVEEMGHSSTNDDDCISLANNTPKRTPSPNVSSSDENDSDSAPKNDEFNYKMSTFDRDLSAPEGQTDPYRMGSLPYGPNLMEFDEVNQKFDDNYGKQPEEPVVTDQHLETINRIVVVNQTDDNDCIKLELDLDRRQSLDNLQSWISNYLCVDKANIQIFKFYRQDGDGFLVTSNNITDSVQAILSDIDHVCVRLHIENADKKQTSEDDNYFIRGKGNRQNSISARRTERSLRIKLASESDP